MRLGQRLPHSVLAQWRLPVAAWVLAALVTLISLTLSLTHKNTMHINTADHVGQASVVGSACAVGRRTSTTKLTCSPSWRSPGPKV